MAAHAWHSAVEVPPNVMDIDLTPSARHHLAREARDFFRMGRQQDIEEL